MLLLRRLSNGVDVPFWIEPNHRLLPLHSTNEAALCTLRESPGAVKSMIPIEDQDSRNAGHLDEFSLGFHAGVEWTDGCRSRGIP